MLQRDAQADLQDVAEMSDQIRQISRQAFLMQLHSANAIVMSVAHGVSVPGFGVVSEQMRQLSKELGRNLAALRTGMAQWVRVVSRRVADERSRAVLRHAASRSPAAERAARDVLSAPVLADPAAVRARRDFVRVLDDARQLAATGCALARTAKLEAMYGGSITPQLTEAATSFTALADSVDEAVRAIARRIAAGMRRMA